MNIFVSYSPDDTDFVSAVVSQLCANNSALMYCDADTIRTGGGTHNELRAAIAHADVTLVFWCHHSFTSYDVRKELTLALEQGKDVVPLLLDGTPLPRTLVDRRFIDLRAGVGAVHEGSPELADPKRLAERVKADRLIATDLSRQYEDLLIMSVAREIETELASRLGPK